MKKATANPELSGRYYIAEATIWLLSGTLAVSWFFDPAQNQPLPFIKIVPKDHQDSLIVVTILLFAMFLYMVYEWKLSSSVARGSPWNITRIEITIFSAIGGLWSSYPLVTYGTQFASVSPWWYPGFVSIGFLIGLFVSMLILPGLMIRRKRSDYGSRPSPQQAARNSMYLSQLFSC
uniref:Uncharacterized protein n=1 Tax=Candidatus Kentrum sp. TUN TaxID=2126343 RepID=A0A450ZKS1_9GAMM|nr:MAG: hypothetical protein BECKTUN1418D_GA0071000_102224 [Candidatus Kentron sp. TUN]